MDDLDPLEWIDSIPPLSGSKKRSREEELIEIGSTDESNSNDGQDHKFAKATGEIVGFDSSDNESDSSTDEDDSDDSDDDKVIVLPDDMFKKEKEKQERLLRKQREGRIGAAVKPQELTDKEVADAKERSRLCKTKPSKPTISFERQGKKIEFYEQISIFGYMYHIGDKVMLCKKGPEIPEDHTRDVEAIFLQYKEGEDEDDIPRMVDMLDYINYFEFGEIEQIFKNIQGLLCIEYKRYIHAMLVNNNTDPSLERQLYVTSDSVITLASLIIGPVNIIQLSRMQTPPELIPQFGEDDDNSDEENNEFEPPTFVCLEGCKVDESGKKTAYTIIPALKIIESDLYVSGYGLHDFVYYSGKKKFYEHPYFIKEVMPVIRHLIRYGAGFFRTIKQSKLLLNSLICSGIEMEEMDRPEDLVCSCMVCGKSQHLSKRVAKTTWMYKMPTTNKQLQHEKHPGYIMKEFARRYSDTIISEEDGPVKTITGYLGTDCMKRLQCAKNILKSCRDLLGFLVLSTEAYKKKFAPELDRLGRYVEMHIMHAKLSKRHRKLMDDALYL